MRRSSWACRSSPVTGGELFDRYYTTISKHLDNYPREFIGHGIGLGSSSRA